jgi:hypothetical protein
MSTKRSDQDPVQAIESFTTDVLSSEELKEQAIVLLNQEDLVETFKNLEEHTKQYFLDRLYQVWQHLPLFENIGLLIL